MAKQRKKLLIVDGYNVLRSGSRYRWQPRADEDYTDDFFNTARERLINDVVNFAGRDMGAVIVFDAGDNELSQGSRTKVGGVDVRDYKIESLRSAIGVVLQKNVLFSGTIKQNLLWGNPNATDEEIYHAAQAAQAHDFIMGFPDKYETYIEQGGTNVSGGQKQRLCIARA